MGKNLKDFYGNKFWVSKQYHSPEEKKCYAFLAGKERQKLYPVRFGTSEGKKTMLVALTDKELETLNDAMAEGQSLNDTLDWNKKLVDTPFTASAYTVEKFLVVPHSLYTFSLWNGTESIPFQTALFDEQYVNLMCLCAEGNDLTGPSYRVDSACYDRIVRESGINGLPDGKGMIFATEAQQDVALVFDMEEENGEIYTSENGCRHIVANIDNRGIMLVDEQVDEDGIHYNHDLSINDIDKLCAVVGTCGHKDLLRWLQKEFGSADGVPRFASFIEAHDIGNKAEELNSKERIVVYNMTPEQLENQKFYPSEIHAPQAPQAEVPQAAAMEKVRKPLGKLIQEEVNRRGLSYSQFANSINTSRSNVYDIFKKESIDSSMLCRINNVLQRDFFKEISDELCSVGDSDKGLASVDKEGIYSGLSHMGMDARLLRGKRASIKNREELKAVINEYVFSSLSHPLLIIEQGFTFGASEVVEQVVDKAYGNGYLDKPKTLFKNDLASSSYKFFLFRIDEHTFHTRTDFGQWISELVNVYNQTGKHCICVVHLADDELPTDFFNAWHDLFYCVEYRWTPESLLSWAKDNNLHTTLIAFIETLSKNPKFLTGSASGQPAAFSCSAAQWLAASRYLSNDEVGGKVPAGMHDEITEFISISSGEKSPAPHQSLTTISTKLRVGDCLYDIPITLNAISAAALLYLYPQWCQKNDADTDFDKWLRDNHEQLHLEAREAVEKQIRTYGLQNDGKANPKWKWSEEDGLFTGFHRFSNVTAESC